MSSRKYRIGVIGSSYGVQSGSVGTRLGGAASLTKTTAGIVTLDAANTYTGQTSVLGGTLRIGVTNERLSDLTDILIDGGTLDLDVTGSVTIVAPGLVAAVGDVILSAGGNIVINGNVNAGPNTVDLDATGSIAQLGGAVAAGTAIAVTLILGIIGTSLGLAWALRAERRAIRRDGQVDGTPAVHARLGAALVIVGNHEEDGHGITQALPGLGDFRFRPLQLLAGGQQPVPVEQRPVVVLHVGQLQVLHAQLAGQVDDLRYLGDIVPGDRHVQHHGETLGLDLLGDRQLPVETLRSRQQVGRVAVTGLETQLNVLESRLLERRQSLRGKPDSRRDQVGVEAGLAGTLALCSGVSIPNLALASSARPILGTTINLIRRDIPPTTGMFTPMPGAARESRFTTRKPYSVRGLGVTNVSRAVLLADAGPPYTGTSTGYFLAGSRSGGSTTPCVSTWIRNACSLVPSKHAPAVICSSKIMPRLHQSDAAATPPAAAEDKDKAATGKKEKAKPTRLVYSDSEVSPEEKMARLPRYAFVPLHKQETVLAEASTAAIARGVTASEEVINPPQ